MRGTTSFLLAGILVFAASMTRGAGADDHPANDLPEWLSEVQTYCMLPVLPERAAELNVSVNGVWAGIGSADPVLPPASSVATVRGEYGADTRAFVDACHDAGLVVAAVVNGLEGFPALEEMCPNLEEMACQNAEGKPVDVGQFILMCTNNPDWVQWEVDFGKRAIDLGADLILVDTPMASSFLSGGMLKAGLCPHCMANFRKYLREKFSPEEMSQRLGIEDFKPEEVIPRLSSRQTIGGEVQPFLSTAKDDLLFREFIFCQEEASFQTRKALVDRLRRHAAREGRKVAFCTNAADLGTQNPFGHWVRALMFADVFDLFVYEQDQLVGGMPSDNAARLPRGKWAAYHKLAHSIYHRRSAAVFHASAMGKVLEKVLKEGATTNAWTGVQCAEAYAANGAYILFYIEPAGLKMFMNKCWTKAIETSGFVQSHKGLYEGDLRSGSPLAVLFLYNERGRTIPSVFPSYLGLAQALVEGNYPFDVVFAGDGRYVEDRLTRDALASYKSIIVPSPIDPTENQKKIVRDFVKSGGTLVCQEPEVLGFDGEGKLVPVAGIECAAGQFEYGEGRLIRLSGEVTKTGTDDAGSHFFRTYDPKLREEIGKLAEQLGLSSILDRSPDGLVSAFSIVQPERKRVVVHVVNYDVDYDADTTREKANLRIKIPTRSFLSPDVKADLYAPNAAGPEELEVALSGGVISCTIPRLAISVSVVFSNR